MRGLICLAAMLIATPALAGARHYTIVDLGSPGSAASFGRAINNHGVVAGFFETDAGTTPFFEAPGAAAVVIVPATTAYDFSDAVGINDAGQIAGTLRTVTQSTAFRYMPGTGVEVLAPLPDDDGTEANAINAAGTIAGTSIQARGPRGNISAIHGFSTAVGSNPVDTGSIDGGFTFGYAINGAGQVAGQSTVESASEHGADHAIVYTPGFGIVDIDPFGSTSHARAINDAGQVAGYAFTPDRDFRRAFLYTPGAATRVLNPAGVTDDYSADGINAAGMVVGEIAGIDRYDGFVFDGRQTLTLDARVIDNLADGDHVYSAYAINDLGQITGDALIGGALHAFRLDPGAVGSIPEPASWALLVAGFGLTGAAVRRRRGVHSSAS